MRSKSAAERSKGEGQEAAPRPLHAPGTLSLVRGPDPRPAGEMKPGLY
jgi:hypothetical protein